MTKRVVITGGTGLLGKELVSRLLADNYEVITTTSTAEKISTSIDDKHNAVIKHVNFLNELQIENFENYIKSVGKIDFLINNARCLNFLNSDNLGLCSVENLMSEFKINVAVPMRLSNFLIHSGMAPQGIINISSQYGSVVPNQTIYENLSEMSPIQYNVSKAAIDKLTKELAVRLAPFKTKVNGIAYGGVKGRASDTFVKNYEAAAPHSRMLNLEECYGPLRWLMSEDSSALNGQIIEANKGWTLC